MMGEAVMVGFVKRMRGVALLAALAPLGACALADVGSGPPPSLYVLTAPEVEAAAAPSPAQIVVEEFAAPAALDTARIVFKPNENEIAYYAGARWADRAPRMIASLTIETLTDTGRFSAVTGTGAQTRTDYVLSGDIRAFHASRDSGDGFGAGATKAKVAFFVRLIRMHDRAILASREFSAETPAGAGMDAVVAAFDASSDAVMAEIADWVAAHALAAGEGS